jgi:MFS family permease
MKALGLRTYRRILAAYAVNALGTWLGEIALSIVVLRETGSPAAVASVWVAGLLVPALVGPLLVTRLERPSPRVVLPALLALEAALFALLALIVSSGFSLPLVLALAAADGVLALAARALLKASIVGTTEPHGLLREGNELFTTVFTSCMAIGPVIGGLVVGFASPQAALALDAISFSLAAMLLARAGLSSRSAPAESQDNRFREGLRYVRGNASLRPLLWTAGAVCLFGAAILPVEVVMVTEVLGADEATYGTVLSLWGAGAIAGTALLPAFRRLPLPGLIAGALTICGISYLGMGAAGSVGVLCAFSVFGGISNGVEAYAVMTAIQELTAEEHQARVAGFTEAVMSAATGVGFLAGGVVAALIEPRAVYMGAGAGIIATAVLVAGRQLAASSRPDGRATVPLRA